jgi:hypothetical protein
MTLTTYDIRAGIAVDSNTETTSIDEMRFVKLDVQVFNLRKPAGKQVS